MTKLEEALELISDKSRWCRDVLARNRENEPVSYYSDKACKWCAMGALEKIYKNKDLSIHCALSPDFLKDINTLNSCSKRNVIHTNDELGHEAVIEMYKKAIEKQKEMNQ